MRLFSRLEREGLVRSEWRIAESGRRRRYYALTDAGIAAITTAVVEWHVYSRRLLQIIDPRGASHAGS